MNDEQPDNLRATHGIVSPRSGALLDTTRTWRPGQSGNPAGGPKNAGRSWQQLINEMSHWPRADIQAVADSDDTPEVQRAAAKEILRWSSDQLTAAGAPIAGASADRILAYTIGKPQQSINVSHTDAISLPDAQLLKMSTARLRLLAQLINETETNAGAISPPALSSPPPETPAD